MGRRLRKSNVMIVMPRSKSSFKGKGGIGVKERPSNKLDVVECVDCHRGVLAKKKDTFDAIKKRCIECHDQSYGEMVIRWKATRKIVEKIGTQNRQRQGRDRSD